ncbi:MAG: hypothetical protein NTZ17_04980 [Phycisphaerae bacterium]|nr:hypothetical protein [Phycisphaerae bacterium]
MKPNPNLDELLSSFMDDQLSPRQRTEVQRLAAHDPQVARRLRQLQNCRTLFNSLPAAKAPSDLLEQIKASLERHTLLQEQPTAGGRSFGAWQLAFRRFVSAAAVIALVGVLGMVVYQIVSPIPPGGVGSRVAQGPSSPAQLGPMTATPILVADAGFTGRLELRTAKLVQVDTFLGRTIENSGLSSRVESTVSGNQRVYRIAGTRASVNRLVASLSGLWQNFDSAALQVDRSEGSAAPVLVEAITPEQTASIVAQGSTKASLDTAANYAIMNHMAKNMPGNEIRPLIQTDSGSLFAAANLPQPRETGPDNTGNPKSEIRNPKSKEAQDKALVNLTIVLLNSR